METNGNGVAAQFAEIQRTLARIEGWQKSHDERHDRESVETEHRLTSVEGRLRERTGWGAIAALVAAGFGSLFNAPPVK